MSRIWVDRERADYVKDVFAQSGSLGGTLNSKLKTSWQGEVTAEVDIPNAHPFHAGGICKRTGSIAGLTARLNVLLSNEGNICILYDESFKRNDPCVSLDSWSIFEADDVYHVIPSFSSVDLIEKVVLEATSGVHLMGVVTHCPGSAQLCPGQSVGREEVMQWAHSATHAFVEICDGETYLIWQF